MSISDRALLRKYKSSEQVQEISRQAETYKETTAVVKRVDGHPPEPAVSLYDRILLRKYSVPGTAVSPPVSLPAESMKKRRSFYQKGKLSKDVTKEDPQNENSQDQEGSPCGFSSKVAEPPVRAGTIISPSAPSSELAHFTLLYYTLVQDGALPLGYLRGPWKHQHAKLRTGCKLQRLPFQIPLLPRLFLHFAESQNIEHLLKNRLQISWLLPLI